jgi:hypothetical protein
MSCPMSKVAQALLVEMRAALDTPSGSGWRNEMKVRKAALALLTAVQEQETASEGQR